MDIVDSVGAQTAPVDLVGKFCAWKNDRPLVLTGPREEDELLLPCFTELEALKQFLSGQSLRWHAIKTIYDQHEFLKQVRMWRRGVIVALDPCFTGSGLRYHEIRLLNT